MNEEKEKLKKKAEAKASKEAKVPTSENTGATLQSREEGVGQQAWQEACRE
jgi:hypothetical protein